MTRVRSLLYVSWDPARPMPPGYWQWAFERGLGWVVEHDRFRTAWFEEAS